MDPGAVQWALVFPKIHLFPLHGFQRETSLQFGQEQTASVKTLASH